MNTHTQTATINHDEVSYESFPRLPHQWNQSRQHLYMDTSVTEIDIPLGLRQSVDLFNARHADSLENQLGNAISLLDYE